MEQLHDLDSIKQLIVNNTFTFLYISSEGCNVCKQLRPKVAEMLSSYPKVVSRYVEVSDVPAVAGEFSVFSVPVLLFFVDGKETIRESRYVNMRDLQAKVERYYSLFDA